MSPMHLTKHRSIDMQVVPVYVQVGCAYSPYRPWPWPRFSPSDARARSAHRCAGPLSAGDARLRAAVGGGQLPGRVELRVGELAAGGDAELPEHLAQVVVDGGGAEVQLCGDLCVGR